eukprot:1938927-Amphidinium_carterae.1
MDHLSSECSDSALMRYPVEYSEPDNHREFAGRYQKKPAPAGRLVDQLAGLLLLLFRKIHHKEQESIK